MSEFGVGGGRLPEPPEPKGFFGNLWGGIKSGMGKVGSWIGGSPVGKAGKWVWKHKAPILRTAGGAVEGLGLATGNPAIAAAGAGMGSIGEEIQEGEAKKALTKLISERLTGNKHISYMDMPRIHYSRKPTSMRIYGPHRRWRSYHNDYSIIPLTNPISLNEGGPENQAAEGAAATPQRRRRRRRHHRPAPAPAANPA